MAKPGSCLDSINEATSDVLNAGRELTGDELGEPMPRDAPSATDATGLAITEKNTFIHFDTHEREMPTGTAPGVMLRRLFRTKAPEAPKPDPSAAECGTVIDTINDDIVKADTLKTDAVETEQKVCRVDADSRVEPESIANSPAEKEGANSTISAQLHKSGSCTPCNYFQYKVDGCRLAENCPFCHICPKGEVKKRKKEKWKELKAAGSNRPDLGEPAYVRIGSVTEFDEPETQQAMESFKDLSLQDAGSRRHSEVETICSSAQGDEVSEPMPRDAPPVTDPVDLAITQKNTFIHFDIPKDPLHEREMPTTSAPGKVLSRLFRTKKAPEATKPESSTAECGILSSPMNDDIVNADTFKIDAVEAEQNFCHVDTDSRFETDSFAISPIGREGETAAASAQVNLTAEKKLELHRSGSCTPCNYFQYKVDGCRMAENCPFCHLCPKGELKKRKKEKLKELKAAGMNRSLEQSAIAPNMKQTATPLQMPPGTFVSAGLDLQNSQSRSSQRASAPLQMPPGTFVSAGLDLR